MKLYKFTVRFISLTCLVGVTCDLINLDDHDFSKQSTFGYLSYIRDSLKLKLRNVPARIGEHTAQGRYGLAQLVCARIVGEQSIQHGVCREAIPLGPKA
jgi:hypothetical protein